tara:strand:+ start:189 stop:614 length:426 start_codon:yes stop_codon:yes gene_type:complete
MSKNRSGLEFTQISKSDIQRKQCQFYCWQLILSRTCQAERETRYWAIEYRIGLPELSTRKQERVRVDIEEKVIGIVSEQLNFPKEEINSQSSFQDDLKADSLDLVELVMEFEEEFDITIPDDDYEKIRTVGDAVKYIQEKS